MKGSLAIFGLYRDNGTEHGNYTGNRVRSLGFGVYYRGFHKLGGPAWREPSIRVTGFRVRVFWSLKWSPLFHETTGFLQ